MPSPVRRGIWLSNSWEGSLTKDPVRDVKGYTKQNKGFRYIRGCADVCECAGAVYTRKIEERIKIKRLEQKEPT